jgi:acetyl-CoA carboxylase biotin carboxyl carrier protein
MSTEVRAELAGNVWKIQAAEGDVLADGAVILIMECMKMEIPITVGPGVLKEMRVAEGIPVQEGQVLAVIDEVPS